MNIDDEWSNFLNNTNEKVVYKNKENVPDIIPTCSKINISTKTKILFFNIKINLEDIFWKIPMISYDDYKIGVIKKQMKFNFTEEVSVIEMEKNLVGLSNVDQFIITQIINPAGRIKFKDIRKVSIGLSNKDITSYRSKKKERIL